MTMIYTYDGTNSSCNLTTAAQSNACDIFYYLKGVLKQAGWTVVRSGDGSASPGTSGVNYGSADYITGYGSGANGINNNGAWYVVQQPGSSRQILVQRSATLSSTFAVYYSYSAGFSGGSWNARTAPTATDSQTVANCLWSGAATYRFSIGADNAAPYGFYMFTFPTGGGNPYATLIMEPLVTGTYDSSDSDPYVFIGTQTTAASAQVSPLLSAGLISETAGTGPLTWFKVGTASAAWVQMPGMNYQSSVGAVFPAGAGTNPFSGNDEIIPIMYGRRNGIASSGFKGVGSLVKWLGPSRSTGDTLSIGGTRNYVTVGNITLPWNGSTPTV